MIASNSAKLVALCLRKTLERRVSYHSILKQASALIVSHITRSVHPYLLSAGVILSLLEYSINICFIQVCKLILCRGASCKFEQEWKFFPACSGRLRLIVRLRIEVLHDAKLPAMISQDFCRYGHVKWRGCLHHRMQIVSLVWKGEPANSCHWWQE